MDGAKPLLELNVKWLEAARGVGGHLGFSFSTLNAPKWKDMDFSSSALKSSEIEPMFE